MKGNLIRISGSRGRRAGEIWVAFFLTNREICENQSITDSMSINQ